MNTTAFDLTDNIEKGTNLLRMQLHVGKEAGSLNYAFSQIEENVAQLRELLLSRGFNLPKADKYSAWQFVLASGFIPTHAEQLIFTQIHQMVLTANPQASLHCMLIDAGGIIDKSTADKNLVRISCMPSSRFRNSIINVVDTTTSNVVAYIERRAI